MNQTELIPNIVLDFCFRIFSNYFNSKIKLFKKIRYYFWDTLGSAATY